jgi:hypothetical protein
MLKSIGKDKDEVELRRDGNWCLKSNVAVDLQSNEDDDIVRYNKKIKILNNFLLLG